MSSWGFDGIFGLERELEALGSEVSKTVETDAASCLGADSAPKGAADCFSIFGSVAPVPNGDAVCLGEEPKPPPNGEFVFFPGAVNFGNAAPFLGAAPAPNGEAPCFPVFGCANPCLGGAPNPDPNLNVPAAPVF